MFRILLHSHPAEQSNRQNAHNKRAFRIDYIGIRCSLNIKDYYGECFENDKQGFGVSLDLQK